MTLTTNYLKRLTRAALFAVSLSACAVQAEPMAFIDEQIAAFSFRDRDALLPLASRPRKPGTEDDIPRT